MIKEIKKDKLLFWQNKHTVGTLKNLLINNGIAVTSTDTLYGFLANITESSFNSLCKLKGGESFFSGKRPFIILISSFEKLSIFVDVKNLSVDLKRFVNGCWPGPVTIIFKAKPDVPSFLLSEKRTIGLRCPDHSGLQAILRSFDGLFSTSANRSCMSAPTSISEIAPEILGDVACVVAEDFSNSKLSVKKVKPSSIIDVSCVNCFSHKNKQKLPFRIVREGTYSVNKLKEIYELSRREK